MSTMTQTPPKSWIIPLIFLVWMVPLKMLSLSIERSPRDLPQVTCKTLSPQNPLATKVKIPFEAALFTLPTGYRAKVISASIRSIADAPWYQFIIEGEQLPFYISAVNGREGANEDQVYADEIARFYLDQNGIQQTQLLTHFDKDYSPFQRILPVYQFDSKDLDGDRVYVSTALGHVVFHRKMKVSGPTLTWADQKAEQIKRGSTWKKT